MATRIASNPATPTLFALTSKELQRFKMHRFAWAFFAAQSSSYQEKALEWITSAKQPQTRAVRLAVLFDASGNRALI